MNASEKLNADQLKRLAGLPPAERDGIRDRFNREMAKNLCKPNPMSLTMVGQDCEGMSARAFNSFLTTPEQSLDYKPEVSKSQFCAALANEGARPVTTGFCIAEAAWEKFQPLAGVALRTAVGMQPGGQFVLGAVDTVAFIANAKDGFEKFANSTKEAGVTATNEVLMNLLKVSSFQVDDAFRDMWGIFSGIGIVLLALMYFKLFKDLSDEKIDFDTVRQSLFWFGPLSILLAIFGPALAYVGNSWLTDLTGAISPWTSNQIMDFATTISRFASYESNGVFGPLAAVLLFGLLFVGAWALLGLFALQPLALYLLGVGLALMIGFMIHPQYRARVAKTGSLWLGIALSKPLILLLMGALFSFISSRPAFQGEGTDDAMINASSVFTAAAAMLVLAFSPALLFKFVPILPSSATSLGANRPSIAGAAMVAGAGAAMGSMIRKRRTAQSQSGSGGSSGPGGSSRPSQGGPAGGTAAVGAGVGAGGQRGAGAAARQGSAGQESGSEAAPETRTLGEMQADDRAGTPSGKAAQSLRGGAAAVGRGTGSVARGSAKVAAGGATAFLLAGRESARQASMRGRQGVNSMAPDTDHISGR
ncbi:hypothetical protein [Arthrobacter sp. Soil762]|uniref:hypothetical protein n=1 Tax=Arthrobacter sp. Soil762 TaxID=1736401 RepID=UPI001F271D13|nr:hypothetical protein [Arthrobacter sp. Soil762]